MLEATVMGLEHIQDQLIGTVTLILVITIK